MDSEGLLCEVLSRLPAKSIIRSGAVSKTCSSFPSDNFFLKKHSEQSLLMDDLGFFIQQDQGWGKGKVELHTLPKNDGEKKNLNKTTSSHDQRSFDDYGVPHNSLQFLYNRAKILGSYNGLLVLKNTNEEDMGLFLCNPATQKFLSIPNLTANNSIDHSTFGIHIVFNTSAAAEFPDNYGVIMVKPTEDWSPYSNIYMYIKGQAWKEVGRFNTGARNILYDMPVYCKGAIHFISDTFGYLTKASPDYKPYIVACEIDKATSRRLKLPKEATRNAHDQTSNMKIFKWGKSSSSDSQSSICLVRLRKSVFMVWVLDDYEVGSWTLVLKTRVRAMVLEEPDPVVCGFTIMNWDSLLFATEERIYGYRLTLSNGRPRHSVRAEEISGHDLSGCRYVCLTSYANTLRPCGDRELALPYESQEEEEKCGGSPNARYTVESLEKVVIIILCFVFLGFLILR